MDDRDILSKFWFLNESFSLNEMEELENIPEEFEWKYSYFKTAVQYVPVWTSQLVNKSMKLTELFAQRTRFLIGRN